MKPTNSPTRTQILTGSGRPALRHMLGAALPAVIAVYALTGLLGLLMPRWVRRGSFQWAQTLLGCAVPVVVRSSGPFWSWADLGLFLALLALEDQPRRDLWSLFARGVQQKRLIGDRLRRSPLSPHGGVPPSMPPPTDRC